MTRRQKLLKQQFEKEIMRLKGLIFKNWLMKDEQNNQTWNQLQIMTIMKQATHCHQQTFQPHQDLFLIFGSRESFKNQF